MSTLRRRRLIDHGWYLCYLGALSLSLSVLHPSDAHAWCNTFGGQDCSQVNNPCPWACNRIGESHDSYDPDSGCGEFSPNICRTGTCYIYEKWEVISGPCAWLCYYEDFSYCVY